MAIRFVEDPTSARLAALEQRVAELEVLLRNVTPVTRNAGRNVTRNASNAERQRRYRERRAGKRNASSEAALKNKNSA